MVLQRADELVLLVVEVGPEPSRQQVDQAVDNVEGLDASCEVDTGPVEVDENTVNEQVFLFEPIQNGAELTVEGPQLRKEVTVLDGVVHRDRAAVLRAEGSELLVALAQRHGVDLAPQLTDPGPAGLDLVPHVHDRGQLASEQVVDES